MRRGQARRARGRAARVGAPARVCVAEAHGPQRQRLARPRVCAPVDRHAAGAVVADAQREERRRRAHPLPGQDHRLGRRHPADPRRAHLRGARDAGRDGRGPVRERVPPHLPDRRVRRGVRDPRARRVQLERRHAGAGARHRHDVRGQQPARRGVEDEQRRRGHARRLGRARWRLRGGGRRRLPGRAHGRVPQRRLARRPVLQRGGARPAVHALRAPVPLRQQRRGVEHRHARRQRGPAADARRFGLGRGRRGREDRLRRACGCSSAPSLATPSRFTR